MIEGFKIPKVTFRIRTGDEVETDAAVLLVVNGIMQQQIHILKVKE